MKVDKNVVLIRKGPHRGKLGVYVADSLDMAVVIIESPKEKTYGLKVKHEHLLDVEISVSLIKYLNQEA